jgi:hypothetical protein
MISISGNIQMGHRSAFCFDFETKMLIDRMIRANIIFVAKETFPSQLPVRYPIVTQTIS